MTKPAPRRTQQARREHTIRALVDATIATLVEHGYAATTVARICEAAELSQGALFRHFATREELMVAVGRDIGARQLAQYRERFVALRKSRRTPRGKGEVTAALELVRGACRSPLNQAWYELMLAARTSDALRTALAPAARDYYTDIHRMARELLPDLAAELGASFTTLIGVVLAAFDGETLQHILVKDAEAETKRIPFLVSITDRMRH